MKAHKCNHSRCLFLHFNKKIHVLSHLVQLLKSNLVGILAEAPTAHVETVLADQTVMVAADSAVNKNRNRVSTLKSKYSSQILSHQTTLTSGGSRGRTFGGEKTKCSGVPWLFLGCKTGLRSARRTENSERERTAKKLQEAHRNFFLPVVEDVCVRK